MLFLTVAWKIANESEPQHYSQDNLIKFFENNHFSVVVTDESPNNPLIIRATRASCHLQIATLLPDGSNRDLIRHLAAGRDRLFVVFRGAVYAQQPVFWTVVDYFWSRFLRKLGLIENITPVINVAVNSGLAANSSCDAEGLPWGELERCFRRDRAECHQLPAPS